MKKIEYTISLNKLLLFVGAIGILSAVVIFWVLYAYAIPLNFSGSDVVVSRPRIATQTDFPAQALFDETQHVFVSLYKINTKNIVYLPADRVGYGAAVTADGWFVMTVHDVPEITNETIGKYVLIGADAARYKISQVYFDTVSGVYFIKADATGFSPAHFVETQQVAFGDSAYLSCATHAFVSQYGGLSYGESTSYKDLIHSSDVPSRHVLLDAITQPAIDCAALERESGLFALSHTVNDSTTFIPAEYFMPIISSILKTGHAQRPKLGLSYVNLDAVLFVDPSSFPARENGAYIYSFGARSIIRASAADLAGLKEKDVIIQVGNEKLNARRTLAEVLLDYHVGDVVPFEIVRGQEVLTITVTLQ